MKENEHKYSHSFKPQKLNTVLKHPVELVEHTIHIHNTVFVLHSYSIQNKKHLRNIHVTANNIQQHKKIIKENRGKHA
jgi:hypothetical protein